MTFHGGLDVLGHVEHVHIPLAIMTFPGGLDVLSHVENVHTPLAIMTFPGGLGVLSHVEIVHTPGNVHIFLIRMFITAPSSLFIYPLGYLDLG